MTRSAWTNAFNGTKTKPKNPFGAGSPLVRDVRKTTRPMEDDEQAAVIEWASKFVFFNGEPLSCYMHHSPNGGKRETKTNANGQTYCPEGARLKKMGTQKGFPDLFLYMPRGGYCGLFIEMKVRGGSVATEQRSTHKRMVAIGYMAEVCYGSIETIDLIKKYMAFPLTIVPKQELI
jgi:hypothetical protein